MREHQEKLGRGVPSDWGSSTQNTSVTNGFRCEWPIGLVNSTPSVTTSFLVRRGTALLPSSQKKKRKKKHCIALGGWAKITFVPTRFRIYFRNKKNPTGSQVLRVTN